MRILKFFAIAIVALLVCIAGFELVMHLTHTGLAPSLRMADAERAFHLRPNAHGFSSEENPNDIALNSAGFHDTEHTPNPAPGTLRIAILGSSPVEADHIPLNDNFLAIIQRELQKCPTIPWKNIEVLNFGVDGYGMPQQYMTLEKDVWNFHPQIVIELVALDTDILNSDRSTSINATDYPYFTAQGAELLPDEATRAAQPIDPAQVAKDNNLAELKNKSQFALLIDKILAKLHERSFFAKRARPVDPNLPLIPPPDRDYGFQNAWRVSTIALTKMHQSAVKHDAEFWIVTSDLNEQVYPDLNRRETLRTKIQQPDLFYPDNRIGSFAEMNGIPFLLLAPQLAEYTVRNKAFIHGFSKSSPNEGHWNILGNRMAGELIAQKLCGSSATVLTGKRSTDADIPPPPTPEGQPDPSGP